MSKSNPTTGAKMAARMNREDPDALKNFTKAAQVKHTDHAPNFTSWRMCKSRVCRDSQVEYGDKFVVHGKER